VSRRQRATRTVVLTGDGQVDGGVSRCTSARSTSQPFVGDGDLLRLARHGRDHVAARQRTGHKPPAGVPRGTEDDHVHSASQSYADVRQRWPASPARHGREDTTWRRRARHLHEQAWWRACRRESVTCAAPGRRRRWCRRATAPAPPRRAGAGRKGRASPAARRAPGWLWLPLTTTQRDDHYQPRGVSRLIVGRHPEQVHAEVAQRPGRRRRRGRPPGPPPRVSCAATAPGAGILLHGGILSHSGERCEGGVGGDPCTSPSRHVDPSRLLFTCRETKGSRRVRASSTPPACGRAMGR